LADLADFEVDPSWPKSAKVAKVCQSLPNITGEFEEAFG
jgi:hypothetical protein